MTIFLKNKHTLQVDCFYFRCCIGKNGISKKKHEGDKKTPKGTFQVDQLYFRKDRLKKPTTNLKCIEIKEKMGWCDDVRYPRKYNRLIESSKKIRHEKLKRKDYKYDLVLPIKYNFYKPIIGMGSCIFNNKKKNYHPTAGCIALKKSDFLIMLKLINKNTKIKIF